MAKKKRKEWDGMLYSEEDLDSYEDQETLNPEDQNLRIKLDSKNRNGKSVTLVTGFIGLHDDLKDLGKELKSACGVGGSVKDGEIIIQGDFREKICQILDKKGYRYKKLN